MAHGGTLFLDEIGELRYDLQVKLLRVLQENEIERVGGNKVIPIRLIVATNANLIEKVKSKEFREDLYYRLNVVPIFLPPLRERMEDLPHLPRLRQRLRDVLEHIRRMKHSWMIFFIGGLLLPFLYFL